ncbi:phosphotransferase family protein [Cercophora newfieldiana]|uniref:Phosphotransferase family protein n=1 Tax=Cercophora newfieldiana TaxID=92897 RepID=A0AA39YH53_9PEZI|nr:phosphotransferase family protein [Cercophora newfieldiana]
MSSSPPASVLTAFGLTGTPTPIPGGRGLCFRISNTILKPCDDLPESQWVSSLSANLLGQNPTSYRLAIPIPSVSNPESYVVDGWTASTFVPGRVSLSHFQDVFNAADALHSDLARIVGNNKPSILAERATNRFTEADLVTWGEKALSEVEKVHEGMLAELRPILDQLRSMMRPLAVRADGDDGEDMDSDLTLANQLVHLDLLGNVLIDEDGAEPPGIIDLTFYWRPAAYARAVVVADGLTRLKGQEHCGDTKRDVSVQLLVRALYWRYLTFAIDPDMEWIRINLPQADYAGAANIICGLVSQS